MSTDVADRLNAALSGRYHIERELGQGGMATVYLADDIKNERKVALKVLKPELAAVVGAERFPAEINRLQVTFHNGESLKLTPNIHVKVRDFLKVLRKGGGPCPRCGATSSEITPNQRITSWCRTCQPGSLIKN